MESIQTGPVKIFPFNGFQVIHLFQTVKTSILQITVFHGGALWMSNGQCPDNNVTILSFVSINNDEFHNFAR